MRWIMLGVATGLVFATLGCTKPQPDPEEVARNYFKTMAQYTREPDPWYQERIYGMLSQSTKATLNSYATRYNERRAEGAPELKPMHMIAADRVRFGGKINSLERKDETSDRVTIVLTFDRGQDTLTVVKETDGWKVDLPLEASES